MTRVEVPYLRLLKCRFRMIRRKLAQIDGTFRLPQRIEYRDSHRLEGADVAGNDRQTML